MYAVVHVYALRLLCAAVVPTTAQILAVEVVHVPAHLYCAWYESVARAVGSAATSAAVLVKVVSALRVFTPLAMTLGGWGGAHVAHA